MEQFEVQVTEPSTAENYRKNRKWLSPGRSASTAQVYCMQNRIEVSFGPIRHSILLTCFVFSENT